MLLNPRPFLHLFLCLAIFALATPSVAQKLTKVEGIVIDAETKEPLPFVNISFAGTTVGTTTDFDGLYSIETQWGSEQLVASYLGYQSDTVAVEIGKSQKVDFALTSVSLNLTEVTVSAKRGKYRKKDNPAVELIRKVIKNKKKNKLENLAFYEYDKYEKIELDLNNITEKFRKRRAFRKFKFIFEYVDTSEINGKPYLPIFMQETDSKVYYRKDPSSLKEYKEAIKITGLDGYLDEGSLTAVMDKLYNDIDIYDNNIDFLTYQFVSPVSVIAPDFYKFYIIDTIDYKGQEVIDLAFLPRNKLDFGFNGNLYISNDDTYQVIKVDMGVLDEINLNFVRDVKIEQEFKEVEGEWVLSRDNVVIDYNLTKKGMGIFGNRTVLYNNYVFNKPQEDALHEGLENTIIAEDAYEKGDDYWEEERPEKLTETEKGVYVMMDTLQKVPAFKRTLNLLSFLFTGYTDIGPVDIGPVNAFYSFNTIEGFRLRLGGRTNLKFNEKVRLEGYGAYGFKDREFKYFGQLTYSFNENFLMHPRKYFAVSYMHETKFPGQVLEYITEDNFLLSFRRGNTERMMFYTSMKGEYFQELPNNFSYHLQLENRKHEPLGTLLFNYSDGNGQKFLEDITTTEARINLAFAPNAQYFNSKNFRYPIPNKYPVLKLFYTLGTDELGGDYNYHQLRFHLFKRFYLSILGYSNVEFEAAKTFGDRIPYLLLHIPRANQTFSYQHRAYNMMNFLEFVSDQYVSINIRHYFNGFFFNKIPLLRKLKLREVATFKGLWGGLTDINNPQLDKSLVQFSETEEGVPLTYTLEDKPYMEASVGVSNIFKILRVDLVKRLTYLDLPNTPHLWGVDGLGIRARAVLEF